MRKFLKNCTNAARQAIGAIAAKEQITSAAAGAESAELRRAKQNIVWQAALAIMTIILTIVIVFTMTAAWYTNIVQTSGLVIQAESWGFDGDIKVNSTTISASPGDEGLVHLEVKSTGDSMSAVSVGASKARLSDNEMQKRLYFYVDTQAMRNGETMERVYLNSRDSYTYNVFGQGSLLLTEQVHNGPQLKWQWVYDVLGYYVLGTWNTATGLMDEREYLRPIEYDYDAATTTFNKDGSKTLLTVDGKTTAEEFLKELSRTDGYPGEINPEKKTAGGYYPVDVDEDGYGVYAYLCTYAEIEQATAYDTELAKPLGEDEEPKTYEVQLNISAQKSDENILHAGTLTALNTAIELNSGSVVQLTEDIALTPENKLVIPAGKQIMLDLNDHTINSTTTDYAIEAQAGSSLVMINGNMTGSGSGYGVYAVGAEVVCSKMVINGFAHGVRIGDNATNNSLDSRVRLVNCEVSGSTTAVYVAGNGSASGAATQLVVENSKLYSDGIVLCGSGNDPASGTDIQIINSELIGNAGTMSAAIYHPQKNSTLSIYGGTLSGYTGIALKGGTASIYDATIKGEGATKNEPKFEGSGFTDTGDAVYVETSYGNEIQLSIHGGSVLTSQVSYSLQVFDAKAPNVNVTIYGGTFDEKQLAYVHSGSTQQESDGKWVVAQKTGGTTE